MEQEKWIKHYSNKHEILLVGEGDFSFAASLARAFGDAHNMVATSLDTEEMLETKHPITAAANLGLLRSKGCTIVHGVDASTMTQHRLLGHRKFDRIVFNFPHAGFPARETQHAQIEVHRSVVRGFVKSGYEMVRAGGQLHITHKAAYPFSTWDIKKLGKEAGFMLLEEAAFDIGDYPGYMNKRGSGCNSNECFPVGASTTFKFIKS